MNPPRKYPQYISISWRVELLYNSFCLSSQLPMMSVLLPNLGVRQVLKHWARIICSDSLEELPCSSLLFEHSLLTRYSASLPFSTGSFTSFNFLSAFANTLNHGSYCIKLQNMRPWEISFSSLTDEWNQRPHIICCEYVAMGVVVGMVTKYSVRQVFK